MTYKINGKSITIPNAEVDKLMSTLHISKNEAIDLWLSDHDYIKDETIEQLTREAKANKITGSIHEARQNVTNTRRPHEKKQDLLKKRIIDIIFNALSDERSELDSIFVRNDEKYIDFEVENCYFTVNLVKHRQK